MKPVVVLGAGGFAREVADIIRDLGPEGGYRMVGFVDRDGQRRGEVLNDSPILGALEDVPDLDDLCGVLGSGDIEPRRRQIAEIDSQGLGTPNLIHPSVIMSPFVNMGRGNVLCAGAIFTNSITIGDFVLFNLGVTIGHDCIIGSNVVFSPGAHVSGWCVVQDECYIGTGAVLLPHVTIGSGSVVGAGAVVTKDVEPGTTVVGMPARPIGSSKGGSCA